MLPSQIMVSPNNKYLHLIVDFHESIIIIYKGPTLHKLLPLSQ